LKFWRSNNLLILIGLAAIAVGYLLFEHAGEALNVIIWGVSLMGNGALLLIIVLLFRLFSTPKAK
jgi:hypothetical protein